MKEENILLEQVGEKLERLRLNKNFLQEEVSKNAKINRKTLSQIENGANFSIKILLKLLEEYGRLDDFLNIITLPKGFDVKAYNKALARFEKKQSI